MLQNCIVSGRTFSVSEFELEYCRENELPLPRSSPFERLRSMLVFRNRPNLYTTTSALSGKRILSCVPPESSFTIYDVDHWQSDRWNPLDYGREYDFRRPFFAQFEELLRLVPMPNLWIVMPTIENSYYTNGVTAAKNCYLIFTSTSNEGCMFSYSLWRCKDVLDSILLYDSELCYECIDCRHCYNIKFCEHCHDCSDSSLLALCYGCRDCYGCVNLNQKQYCFFNEQLSEKEYRRRTGCINLGSAAGLAAEKAKFAQFSSSFPRKSYFGKEAHDCTGSYISSSRNCANSFFISNSEDLESCLCVDGAKSSIAQAMFGNGTELIYNSITVGDKSYNVRFCAECWQGAHDLEYCIACVYGSSTCFGCIGLKKASYCILNKQYAKSEYDQLVPRIKRQMRETGEYGFFFPPSCSPYYYNESAAQEFLPLEKVEALRRGFRWRDTPPETAGTAYRVPDDIREAQDDVLAQPLACAATGKPFKLMKAELDFYRSNSIPLPRVAPMERLKARLSFFNLHELERGACSRCNASFMSSHTGAGRQLLCEDCFRRAVFA